jgi:hypothetical protein
VGDEGEKVEHMVEIEERKEDVGLGTELGLNVEELNYVSWRKIQGQIVFLFKDMVWVTFFIVHNFAHRRNS